MKKQIRFLALILGILMMLSAFASCNLFGGKEEDSIASETESQEVIDLTLTEEQRFWRSVLRDIKEYRIIRPTNAGAYDTRMALVLQSTLQALTSQLVRVFTDTQVAVQDKEILLGETNRAGANYQSTVNAEELADDEYVIEYVDQRAIIHYGDFEGLVSAVKEIVGYLVEPFGKDGEELFDKTIKDVEVYPGNVSINNVYADGMIFQQNKPAVIKGTGLEGFEVDAVLCREDGTEVTKTSAVIDAEGKWELAIEGQPGSYDKYKIKLTVSGITVQGINDVVFGEVWLASGQSNMAYTTIKDIEFKDMPFDDEYMRVLRVATRSSSAGGFSATPLNDNENTNIKWFKGDDEASMEAMSSVAYFYSLKLREELDMPVGIIQYVQGGCPIRSWMSDETIQSNPEILEHYIAKGYYVLPDAWDSTAYRQAKAMYNTMGCLVDDFNIAGMIWYQGEQDMSEDSGDDKNGVPSRYLTELDMFYRQFCEMYGYDNYDMPFIYSLMVPYRCGSQTTYFGEFTSQFAKFAQKYENISAIANYNQNPYYNDDNTASHPNSKRLVGERMASAALSISYGGTDPISSPYPVEWRVENGAMIIKFANVCDGLAVEDPRGIGEKILRGFTICGADGIYTMANAEIISKDELKVWSPYVENPVSVTYAYELLLSTCNLGCSKDGKILYSAVPFCLDEPAKAYHASYLLWMTCDYEVQWRMSQLGHSYCCDCDTWVKVNDKTFVDFDLSFDKENAYSGNSALRVDYKGAGSFGVMPMQSWEWKDGTVLSFADTFSNFSHYNKMSFYVRNDGTEALKLDGVRFKMAYAGLDATSDCADGMIPADGQWHRIVLDLNNLEDFIGNKFDRSYLSATSKIQFLFEGTAGGTLLIDQIEWIL